MVERDIKDAVEIVELIVKLTEGEGDTVLILNDNPDFGGPNSGIVVTRGFESSAHIYGGPL